jgi:hypothetical protein
MNTACQSRNHVAQSCTRVALCRIARIAVLQSADLSKAADQFTSQRLPIENRRYSRFKICATSFAQPAQPPGIVSLALTRVDGRLNCAPAAFEPVSRANRAA